MKRLTILVFVNLVLAILLTTQAFSSRADVTLLVGATQFQDHGDGTWYQEAFPHTLRLRSGALGLRYDTQVTNGISYSLGYMNLGHVSSEALATGIDGVIPGDRGYNPATQSCNGDCGYLSHWYGQGDVQGFFGSRVHHINPSWAIEYGLYVYRPTWEMHIPDWVGTCRECPPIDVLKVHVARWQLSPMLGLRYSVKQWSLNLSTWHTGTEGDEWTGLYHNQAYNLLVGYTF